MLNLIDNRDPRHDDAFQDREVEDWVRLMDLLADTNRQARVTGWTLLWMLVGAAILAGVVWAGWFVGT